MVICAIIVWGFNINYWASGNYSLAPLVVRPFFLVLYSVFFTKIMIKYCRVLYNCLRYFALMWLMVIILSATGYFLFSDMETNGYVINLYEDYGSAVYQTVVIQTICNFPDIALPFVGVSKSYWIFFIIAAIILLMLVSNLIIAINYNCFK
jgi:hypothetical protein